MTVTDITIADLNWAERAYPTDECIDEDAVIASLVKASRFGKIIPNFRFLDSIQIFVIGVRVGVMLANRK